MRIFAHFFAFFKVHAAFSSADSEPLNPQIFPRLKSAIFCSKQFLEGGGAGPNKERTGCKYDLNNESLNDYFSLISVGWVLGTG